MDLVKQYLPYLPYLVIAILLAVLIYKENGAPSKFSFMQYLQNTDGTASTPKTLQVLAGLTATVIVVQANTEHVLTDSIFGIYLAALGVSDAWARYIHSKDETTTSSTSSTTASTATTTNTQVEDEVK